MEPPAELLASLASDHVNRGATSAASPPTGVSSIKAVLRRLAARDALVSNSLKACDRSAHAHVLLRAPGACWRATVQGGGQT